MERLKAERPEQPPFECATITAQELRDKIYRGRSFPQDKRFLSTEDGGVFKYFRLSDLVDPLQKLDSKFYSIAEFNKEIAGLAELETDPYKERNIWLKFVSVDPKYQGRGCASRLIEEVLAFVKKQGCSLEESMYSEEGKSRLKDKIRELATQLGVKLIFHK